MSIRTIFTSVVAAAVVSFGVLHFAGNPQTAQVHQKESVYERVMRTGKIRCGYATWHPFLFKEPNSGEISGVIADLMSEISSKLNLEIEWAEETSFGHIVEGQRLERYDAICTGLYKNGARAKHINFSDPLFYVGIHAIIRQDDERIDSYEDVNSPDTRIVIIEGEAGSIFARNSYPNATFIAIPQISDFSLVYEEVASGKADLAIGEMVTFVNYDEKNPGKLKLLDVQNPASVATVTLGLPSNDVRMKTMIDAALDEFHNDGTIERIIKKYEFTDGMFLPIAKPYSR